MSDLAPSAAGATPRKAAEAHVANVKAEGAAAEAEAPVEAESEAAPLDAQAQRIAELEAQLAAFKAASPKKSTPMKGESYYAPCPKCYTKILHTAKGNIDGRSKHECEPFEPVETIVERLKELRSIKESAESEIEDIITRLCQMSTLLGKA